MNGLRFKAVAIAGVAGAALAGTSALALADAPAKKAPLDTGAANAALQSANLGGLPADGGPSTETALATYQRAFPGITAEQANAAAAGEDKRKQLYTDLLDNDAATFGGAWFDPPTNVMHVATTSAAGAAQAQQLAAKYGIRVQTHPVRHTLAQLTAKANVLRAGGNDLGRLAHGQVGIDVQNNRVTVSLPSQQLQRPAAKAAPAGVGVAMDPNLRTQEDAGCTSRVACDWTLRAGATIFRSGAGCSIGFTGRTTSNLRFVLSAGHCSNGNGVNWWTGGQNIGPMYASINSGVYDVSLIQVTNSWFTGDSGGEIYMDSVSGKSVPLNGVAPSVSYMFQGERVCLSANYAQPNGANLCGVIGAVSDANVRGMTRVDGLDACEGDSGGGWYWLSSTGRRIAYGLHSRSDNGCHGDAGGSHSWYTPIASAKQWAPWLNVEVRP